MHNKIEEVLRAFDAWEQMAHVKLGSAFPKELAHRMKEHIFHMMQAYEMGQYDQLSNLDVMKHVRYEQDQFEKRNKMINWDNPITPPAYVNYPPTGCKGPHHNNMALCPNCSHP
jgi:hypothetical protein